MHRKKITTWIKRAPLIGEAIRWHNRLGYPGPSALEHLMNTSQGVGLRGPTTVECDACGLSKIRRKERRTQREIQEGEGERIAVDFYNYHLAFKVTSRRCC